MEFAEASFLQVIIGRAQVLTGRIERVSAVPANPDLTEGEITLDQVQSIPPGEPLPHHLSVNFAQYGRPESRIKSGGQGWNGVEATKGVYLILALAGDHTPAEALAVQQIKGPKDPLVHQVAWCVDAERHQDSTERLALIREAILRGQGLVAAWGHYCAGRLQRIPRTEAVSLELGLLNNETADEHARLAAAQNLELELWKGGNPDDALDQHIAGAFLSNLAHASSALQLYLIQALHRILFTNAPPGQAGEAYRKKLRDAVSVASEPGVTQTLDSQRNNNKAGPAVEDLLHWLEK